MTAKPTITITVRNGVRVKVTRWPGEGSVVEASCQCFGHPGRVHSQASCPNRKVA